MTAEEEKPLCKCIVPSLRFVVHGTLKVGHTVSDMTSHPQFSGDVSNKVTWLAFNTEGG